MPGSETVLFVCSKNDNRVGIFFLHLSEEYPSFESFSNAEGNIYKTICEFEVSLRRMKDE